VFYVDDRFPSSEPVMMIPPELRLGAVGLWTLAGAWSSSFLKDGHVPAHVVTNYIGGEQAASALVEVKLWRRARSGSYQFLDWPRWQKTRAQVESYRATERERKANARRAKSPEGSKSPEIPGAVPPGQNPPSALPLPHPLPTPDDDGQSQQQLTGGYPQPRTDPSTSVQNARRNPTGVDLDRILEALVSIVADATRLDAAAVAEFYIGRKRGEPPTHPTAYVLGSITRNTPVVGNFIHTGRWSE
jgi:hypothetical protein